MRDELLPAERNGKPEPGPLEGPSADDLGIEDSFYVLYLLSVMILWALVLLASAILFL